jgi:long-chain acyl-CoA synthetase
MCETLPKMLADTAAHHSTIAALCFRKNKKEYEFISYAKLEQLSLDFAAGLLACGVKRNDLIGLIADNRPEWQQASMGIMSIGAMDVPRGSDATEKDISYILSFSDCETTVVENEVLVKKILHVRDDIPLLKHLIVFDQVTDDTLKQCEKVNLTISTHKEILEKGKIFRTKNSNTVEEERAKGQKNDVACVIFTSGTTGVPKGVMLSHSNFITQLDELQERIYLNPNDKALSVLPVWHAFERLCEYVIMIQAATICYSKPVGKVMLDDFQKLNPQLMPAVPRIFESLYEGILRTMRKQGGASNVLFKFFLANGKVYSKISRTLFRKKARIKKDPLVLNWILLCIPWLLLWPLNKLGDKLVFSKIRNRLGNSFRAGISGGGALPPVVDEFFWTVGICVVEGYGMTETAPVISVRPIRNPVFGTIGTPIRGAEAKIVDGTGNALPAGKQGIIKIRGGIVMKGYYKLPELTATVIDKDGWFNTGDLGLKTLDGELILKGRVKDTIVLRGGENVEPLPIEMKLNESRYISQSVVLGQDQRHLGALIIPDQTEIKEFAIENRIIYDSYEELLQNNIVQKLLSNEIVSLVNAKNGFKIFEHINHFECISKELEVGVELSAKQEIKRFAIRTLYEEKIKKLF